MLTVIYFIIYCLTCEIICIKADIQTDGKWVKIHFVGWGNGYDYWANPRDDPALHPIGYIEYMKNSGKDPRATLSPPGSKLMEYMHIYNIYMHVHIYMHTYVHILRIHTCI